MDSGFYIPSGLWTDLLFVLPLPLSLSIFPSFFVFFFFFSISLRGIFSAPMNDHLLYDLLYRFVSHMYKCCITCMNCPSYSVVRTSHVGFCLRSELGLRCGNFIYLWVIFRHLGTKVGQGWANVIKS